MSGPKTVPEELLGILDEERRWLSAKQIFARAALAPDANVTSITLANLFKQGRVRRRTAPPESGMGVRYVYASLSAPAGAQTEAPAPAARPAPAPIPAPAERPFVDATRRDDDEPAHQAKKRASGKAAKKAARKAAKKPAPTKAPKKAPRKLMYGEAGVRKLQPGAADRAPLRCGVYSDGSLSIEAGSQGIDLQVDQTRALFGFLERVASLGEEQVPA